MKDHDDRPQVAAIFDRLKEAHSRLETMLSNALEGHTVEDCWYRYYHHSFKVFWLNHRTREIVLALAALDPQNDEVIAAATGSGKVDPFERLESLALPKLKLNDRFLEVVEDGLSRRFRESTNANWSSEVRPVLEAHSHARYMLEQAVKYGRALERPPLHLPSGWAAFLYLFNLR